MSDQRPEDSGQAGEGGPTRRPGMPPVPPARPRPPASGRPAHHPTTEIDLSGGWPQHLRVPPPPPAAPRRAGGRVMGVDVGTVRVGLALSDPTGTLASPLETLRRAKDGSDLDRLAALAVEHEVTEVVVGEPRHLSGASGASARDADAYARALADRLPSVPVHMIDERLSTVSASSALRASGLDSRRQRPVIDQAAAVLLLHAYLHSQPLRS